MFSILYQNLIVVDIFTYQVAWMETGFTERIKHVLFIFFILHLLKNKYVNCTIVTGS